MKRDLQQLKSQDYDLIIIGGGVSGVSAAWDASLRGLNVALIEKKDFGAGTSSATSKLIHGGLRYLKNLELSLVRESLRERRRLEEMAPHLVYPLPFVLPIYGWFQFFLLWVGMFLYEMLSYDKANLADASKRLPGFSVLSRKKLLAMDSNLNPEGLVGGFQYYDCQSLNPDRLTLAYAQSAVEAGAQLANYVTADAIVREDGRVVGIHAVDNLTGDKFTIRGKIVLTAAGPWADVVLGKAMGHPPQTKIRRSKGIHILMPQRRDYYALTLASGRSHFFIMPWRGRTLIGTTDTEYVGNPDDVDVTADDIFRFTDSINAVYGRNDKIRPEDVVFGYCGLRPLVDKQATSVYNASRKHEIVDHAEEGFDGLMSVIGGKYTTSRELAEEVVNRICAKLGRNEPCSTDVARLAGGDINDMEAFLVKAKADLAVCGPEAAEYIAKQYGTRYGEILSLVNADAKLSLPLAPGDEVLAQVVHAIRNEMAVTLDDILFRRTGAGTLGNPGEATLQAIAGCAKAELGWSDSHTAAELEKARMKMRYPRLPAKAVVQS